MKLGGNVTLVILAGALAFVVNRSARNADSISHSEPSREILPATLSDFWSRLETAEAEPSPVDVSLELLEKLPYLSRKQLKSVRTRLNDDGRYALDPGYQLVRLAVNLHHEQVDPAERIQNLTGQRMGSWEQEQRMMGWAQRDPEAAFSFASNAQPEWLRARYLAAMLKGLLAKTDNAEEAFKYLELIDDDDLRHRLAQPVTMEMARHQPDGADILAEKYPSLRQLILNIALKSLGETNPARALELLNGVSPPMQQMAADNLLEGWIKNDPEAAMKWVSAQSGQVFHPDGYALAALAEHDPELALETALQTGTRRQRLDLAAKVAGEALKNSPEVAVSWMEENLNATEQAWVASGASLGHTDPPEWMQELAEMVATGDAGEKGRVYRFVRQWEDFESKRAWVNALPDLPRQELSGILLPEWAKKEPNAALAYLDSIPYPEGRAHLLQTAIEHGIENSREIGLDQEDFVTWARRHLDAETIALTPHLTEEEDQE